MTPEDVRQLVPAFVGAALVILVVAAGILVFVWRQYPAPRGGGRPDLSLEVDPERLSVERGLLLSGVVVLSLGIAGLCAAAAFGQVGIFGPASLLVELAVAADGVIFLVAARFFSVRT